MCGIAGFIKFNNNLSKSKEILLEFAKKLSHRGPDSSGYWISDENRVGFAHTRLSIQDLSLNGSQPMTSKNARYVIVYNGEIYNFLKLKKILQENGIVFKSSSDTEVLLEYISFFGIDKTLDQLEGMFAFAIYDKFNKYLYLVRDRIGEKPLYYGKINNNFFFSSELKIFKIFKDQIKISQKAVSEYLKYNYIPSNLSIYENIYKLIPGSYLKIDLSEKKLIDEYEIANWWKIESNLNNNKNQIANSNANDIDELDKILNHAVKKQLISDVPIGCFLSGGIDSSLIASYMQANIEKNINTFSIGFKNKEYDESLFSQQISKFLKTNHYQLMIDYGDIKNSIPNLVDVYDEPYADTSQIPTLFMSKFAKEKVGVVLSGDGGDELFGGYNRYVWAPKILKYKGNYFLKTIFNLLNANSIEKLYKIISPFLYSKYKFKSPKDKILKLKYVINQKNSLEIYKTLTRNNDNKYITFDFKYDHNSDLLNKIWSFADNYEDKMMIADILTYLPDDILVKVDRASMSNSLETRVPFLDVDVVKFGINLNNKLKFSKNQNKVILRDLLSHKMPKELLMSNKRGFDAPMDEWMRYPLKGWCNDMLNNKILYDTFEIDKKKLMDDWNGFISHQNEKMFPIWNMVILSSWIQKN